MPRYAVHRHADPHAFERDVQPFLLANEAANGLPLGLLAGLQAGEWDSAYLATVTREASGGTDRLALVAMRTPPHGLVLCEPAELEGLAALAEHVGRSSDHADLPGVLGPEIAARAFAGIWAERRGLEARLATAQRIYRCSRVVPVSGVEGALRPAAHADRSLVVRWLGAFHLEALPGTPFDAEAAADRWLASPLRALYLWEAGGEPVSLAGAAGPTPNGIRIAAVYTPPERRNRGYASAAVAALTQRLLDGGRAFCTLFTDLANPTSNKIYQQIGYVPVLDFPAYRFARSQGATAV